MTDPFKHAPQASAPETSDRNRWLALLVLCTGMLMIVLDATIVNVALPAIQTDLDFSQAGLAWVVNAYLIAFGGLLLLAGRMGDLVGGKRVFLTGLTVFTIASLLCGLATEQWMLIGARFLQGAGGALTSAVSLGMIFTMFTEPGERARALGIFSFVASGGASIGVFAGGVLTETLSWHWIFFVNIPIGIAIVIPALRVLNPSRGLGLRTGADIPGAILVTAALMLGVYTIVKAADNGWGSTRTLSLGALSIILLGLFITRQAMARTPLLPLRLFRSRVLSAANLTMFFMVAPMFGFQFFVALYLQNVLGFSEFETGAGFLPITVMIGAFSLSFAGRLAARFGAYPVIVAGLVMVVVGNLLFVRIPVGGSFVVDVLPSMIIMGAGLGVVFPNIAGLAMASARPEDSGAASGLLNTVQQVGGALGLASLASLAATHTTDLTEKGRGTGEALVGGFHLAFAISTGLAATGLLVALLALRGTSTTEPATEEQKVLVH
ncbi:MFS transporter [Actinocorallia longicatena]|uniref:MFS transporter n=1 Tax=Actinocorallia longicatena TaxID=111803 RepID=A0ABP6QFV5_9ACTN